MERGLRSHHVIIGLPRVFVRIITNHLFPPEGQPSVNASNCKIRGT